MAVVANDPWLSMAFERLDLLLHREILRLRATYRLSLDEFRGLYVSDEQVDDLIRASALEGGEHPTVENLTEQADGLVRRLAEVAGETPLDRMAKTFGLDGFERDVLLLALAPEIDLKYETLYAYLNNDVTRKYPTSELALRLFAQPGNGWRPARRALEATSSLFVSGLLEESPGDGPRSRLGTGFFLSPPAAAFLVGLPVEDAALSGWARITRSVPDAWKQLQCGAAVCAELSRLAERTIAGAHNLPPVVFEGYPGAGRGAAAEALCGALGCDVIRVDTEALLAKDATALGQAVKRLLLVSRLRGAGVYFGRALAGGDGGGKVPDTLFGVMRTLYENGLPIILSAPPSHGGSTVRGRLPMHVVPFGDPSPEERSRLWRRHLDQRGRPVPKGVLAPLGERFALTPGQIERAAAEAVVAMGGSENKTECADALFAAARSQSDADLNGLALKVPLVHDWSDLILPPDTMNQVEKVVSAITQRAKVYGEWGFGQGPEGRKPPMVVMLSGASGVGKTKTVACIARQIGKSLYVSNLASIISKYIGETSRNMDQVFQGVRRANAVLFFDEADVLFARRSSDLNNSNDKYANADVAYLLTKLEETTARNDQDTIIFLATNLSRNIDKAFSRRMNYVIEFPRPDAVRREQLWRGVFPDGVPLADDLDFAFLSERFSFTGGDIHNIALVAANLAAGNGGCIGMEQVLHAVARHMRNQGKTPTPNDFYQYFPLVAQSLKGQVSA